MSEKKLTYCDSIIESRKRYREYINNHIKAVQESYNVAEKAFKDIFPELYTNNGRAALNQLLINLEIHDKSKFDDNEFHYYAARFFPVKNTNPESENNKKNFQIGWLHHVHNNAHHPAHWALVDNGDVIILDMPDIYIIEMLCDWMAMSKYYNSTTLEYWKSESAQLLPMSNYTKLKVNEFMNWMLQNNVHTSW